MKIELKKIDYILMLIAGIALALSLFLAETGGWVLLDESCLLCVVLVVVVRLLTVALVLMRKGKSKRTLFALFLLIAVFFFIFGVGAKDVVVDYFSGTEVLTLTQCNVSKSSGLLGLHRLEYSLMGIDENGQMQKFSISGDAYVAFLHRDTITVECYMNVKRIVAY